MIISNDNLTQPEASGYNLGTKNPDCFKLCRVLYCAYIDHHHNKEYIIAKCFKHNTHKLHDMDDNMLSNIASRHATYYLHKLFSKTDYCADKWVCLITENIHDM